MQMKISAHGSQVSAMASYKTLRVYLRDCVGAIHNWKFDIDPGFCLQDNAVTLQYSWFVTEWFYLDSSNIEWAYNLYTLQENEMRIEIEGNTLSRKPVVARLTYYEPKKNAKVLVDQAIQVRAGVQFFKLSVLGRVRNLERITDIVSKSIIHNL
ncbi:MAG: hypothetical protein P8X96_20500 [Desulfobacteraceae bacterium]